MLNFLRSGDLPPRERVRAVYKEAQYYAIGPLLEQLENMQPLKGEKVRQAFLGLMPYYKGEGATTRGSQDARREGCEASVSVGVSTRRGGVTASYTPVILGMGASPASLPAILSVTGGDSGEIGPTLPAASSNCISERDPHPVPLVSFGPAEPPTIPGEVCAPHGPTECPPWGLPGKSHR